MAKEDDNTGIFHVFEISTYSPLISSNKMRWSNSFIPIRISNTWKVAVLYLHLSPHLRAHNRSHNNLLPSPSWPDSSTGGAVQRHRRGLSSNPLSGLNFSGLSRGCLSSAKMRWSNLFKSLKLQYLFYLSSIDNLQNSCLFSKKLNILENNLERKRFKEALTIIIHKFKWVRKILFPKEKRLF